MNVFLQLIKLVIKLIPLNKQGIVGMNFITDQEFISACKDYFYLIDRRFPERGTLKIVGDRYKLSGDQRTVLYRGISSSAKSIYRRGKLTDLNLGNNIIVIDGYNVLFTIMNYRLGRIMFISTDNMLRDAGSLHGRIRQENLFIECAGILMGYLAKIKPAHLEFFLDAPVSHSERHAALIQDEIRNHSLEGNCSVVRSADHELKIFSEGVIATSDTVIIENSVRQVADLSFLVLKDAFDPVFLDLNEIIKI